MKWLRERMPEKKILPHVRRLILSMICLFIWLPLLMMAGNSFLSRGEMLSRFGPVLNGGTGAVKVTLFPDFPTLSPFVELLLELLPPDRGCAVRPDAGGRSGGVGVCHVFISG